MKNPVLLPLVLASASLPATAALTWTGAGDGVSLYQEANWLDDNNTVPAANTINPNITVSAATGGAIVISSNTGSPSNYGGTFTFDSSNTLQISGGKILGSNTAGVNAEGGTGTATIFSGGTAAVQFFSDLATQISTGGTLRLGGGNNPLNNSTVNLADTTAFLQFNNETYADFDAEHASKVLSQGATLNFGSDPFAVEPGDNALASAFNGADGVQIQSIPEPSSSALLGLAGLTLILRRRK